MFSSRNSKPLELETCKHKHHKHRLWEEPVPSRQSNVKMKVVGSAANWLALIWKPPKNSPASFLTCPMETRTPKI